MRPPLGQHFLRDPHVVQAILAAAELHPEDSALEIGPGKGVLTTELIGRVRHLTAVELDKKLAERLTVRFQGNPRVTIIQSDFLRLNLSEVFPQAVTPAIRQPGSIKILGNLPYSITSPIFEKILAWPHWDTGVFLIQREVADRMRSQPGSRVYGILSLAVQLFAKVENIIQVKPGAFVPPPKVTSTVIRLRRKAVAEVPEKQIPAFFDLVHAAFAHRRKTLVNSLALYTNLPKEKITPWLRRQRMAPDRRAETLGLPEYAQMAEAWSIFRRENDLT